MSLNIAKQQIQEIIKANQNGNKTLFLTHDSVNSEEFYTHLALGVDACQISAISSDVKTAKELNAVYADLKQTDHKIALINLDFAPAIHFNLRGMFTNADVGGFEDKLLVFITKKAA